MLEELTQRIRALFDEHRASPAHPDLTAATNRIINQLNWVANRQLEMEKQMGILADKIDAVVSALNTEKANAANADAMKAELDAAKQALVDANAQKDALQADVNDAMQRLANAGF